MPPRPLTTAFNLIQRVIATARRGDLLAAIPRWVARLSGRQPLPGDHGNLTYLDLEYGLDTGGAVSHPTLTPDGLPYYGMVPSVFTAIMNHTAANPAECTFVDFGSGKGRALFLAAKYPFRRIIGVEVAPELHAVALRNVEIFREVTGCQIPIEPVLADALTYQLPPTPVLAYLYNPFGEKTMARVVRNLKEAHERTGERIDVVYGHPLQERLLDEQHWLRKTCAVEVALTAEEVERSLVGGDSLRVAFYTTAN